jgi:tetratricopeptide (TPR) repeat protein
MLRPELLKQHEIFIWIIIWAVAVIIFINRIVKRKKIDFAYKKRITINTLFGFGLPQFTITNYNLTGNLKQFFRDNLKDEKEGNYLKIIDSCQDHLSNFIVDIQGKVDLNIIMGNCYYYLCNFKESRKRYLAVKRMLKMIRNNNFTLLRQGAISDCLGLINSVLGKPKKAIILHKEAIKFFKKSKNYINMAISNCNLGQIYNEVGEIDFALDFYYRSFNTFKDLNSYIGMGILKMNIGKILYATGDVKKGRSFIKEAKLLLECQKYDFLKKDNQSSACAILSILYYKDKQYKEAFSYLLKSLKNKRDKNMIENGYLYKMKGDILKGLGKYQKAIDNYQTALNIFSNIGHKLGEGLVLLSFGNIYTHECKYQEAIDNYQTALDIFSNIGHKLGEGLVLLNWGIVFEKIKNINDALDFYNRSLEIFEKNDYQVNQIKLNRQIGHLYENNKEYNEALNFYNKSLEKNVELNYILEKAEDYEHIGNVYEYKQEYKDALRNYKESLKYCTFYKNFDNNNYKQILLNYNIGFCNKELGFLEKANSNFKDALKMLKDNYDNKILEGKIYHNLGAIEYYHRFYKQSISLYTKAISIYKEQKDKINVISCFDDIGLNYTSMGNFREAIKNYRIASRLIMKYRKSFFNYTENTEINKMWLSDHLGYLNRKQKKYLKSIYYYKKALKISDKFKHKKTEIMVILKSIGRTYYAMGEYSIAQEYFERIINDKLFESAGRYQIKIFAKRYIGNCLYKMKDYYNAINFYQDALKGMRTNIYEDEVYYYQKIGFCNYYMNLHILAIIAFSNSINIYKELKKHENIAYLFHWTGKCYYELKDYVNAISAFSNALDIYKELKKQNNIASQFAWKGKCYYELKDYVIAISALSNALDIYKELGDNKMIKFCEEKIEKSEAYFNENIINI